VTEAAARTSGSGEHGSPYEISDQQLAAGSTLGAPKAVLEIKATGAIEKFYSVDAGKTVLSSVVLHHWDKRSGINSLRFRARSSFIRTTRNTPSRSRTGSASERMSSS